VIFFKGASTMTIGIAASGPNAGLAVYRSLAAVEKVATGAIGGFCTYAAIDVEGGRLYRAETQRGGTSTLFVDGESTGVGPPDSAAQARVAGLMSSGPDRPAPLAQFVPAEAEVGLITGHRLPNAMGIKGRPLNLEIFDRLRAGMSASEAVNEVLDADSKADAGVIAVDRAGTVYARNSDRVSRRPDLGHARREDLSTGAVVEVIHNAIFPVGSLAGLAADLALGVMVPNNHSDGEFKVHAGAPVVYGKENRVLLDGNVAVRIETTDQRIVTGCHNCAAIYLGARVMKDGLNIGRTVLEPNVIVQDGRIVKMSGQTSIRIGYRKDKQ
jgi:hypothetical protein